jgi:AcrR family transcriptional regulator
MTTRDPAGRLRNARAKAPTKTSGYGSPRGHHTPKERRGGRMTERRQQEIVRKAASLFIQKGYENVTIDDIIALVGGSKATLYARFGGKEGLFETVIKTPCAEVTLAIDIDAKGSTEVQLTRIARTFLKSVLDPDILELHRLMVSIGKTFPSVGAFFYGKGPETAYGLVATWMEKQQRAGRLGLGDPRQLSVLFLDMLIGEHQLSMLTAPRRASARAVDRTVRAAVSLFLYGASARPKAH